MVNGLALRRAANAAQAQAASTNNPTPVHSEDLQPNETLNRRRGAGLPPVVSATAVVGQRGMGLQVAKRGGRGGHARRGWAGHGPAGRGNEATGEYWNVQPRTHGQKSRQPNDEASKESDFVPSQARRPRPIPLPPPSSRFSGQRAAQISSGSSQPSASNEARINSNGERAKPFSMPLPALKPKAPLSGLPTTLPRPASQAAESESRFKEYTPSPKRRKIDLTPEFVSPVSSNITRESIITNVSPLCARPVALPLSPPSMVYPEQRTSNDHAPSPSRRPFLEAQAPATPPIQMKREQESPPLLVAQRRAVSNQFQFYPFPDNCNRTNPEWEANRIALRKEKERELKGRGLQIIGKCITRGDGISIQWKSNVPVWSDTLEPVSPKLPKSSNESKGDSNKTIPTDFPPTSSVTAPNEDSQHHSPHDTVPHSPAPTSSTTTAVCSTPQELPPPRASTSVSSRTIPPSTPIPPSPNHKPLATPKRQRQHVPLASLDLATAIQLSQRNNASPSPRRRITTSSSSVRSTVSPTAKRPGRRPGGRSHLAKDPEQAAAPHVGDGDEKEEVEGTVVIRRKSVLRESSGWTVIQEMAEPDSSDRIEEEVEEEHDQLVEDEEYELRDEMEAAEAASIGTPHDESDDERDQVESVAMLSGNVRPSPVMDVIPEQKDAGSALDHLSQGFITKYMQLYETDRARLISAYAPDAKFIYRVLEDSPTASPDLLLSATQQIKGHFFPLRTARGHAEISSSLGLLRTHFSHKVDDQGNKKIDVEFWGERTGEDIWVYIRSIMAVEDARESSEGKKWAVDHTFLLRKRADKDTDEGEVSEKDDWPVVAHVHQLVMHERPL